ncbi:MAG TPA: zf-HC2 domain-containing protein [Terriglobia bacterium]|nr:zf-HC2 domain-containing protein [Terriglobia bacterium]
MSKENMSKHGECLTDETLADYLSGELDPVVHAACEVHLAACDSCRRSLAALMRLLRVTTTPEEEIHLQTLSRAWDERHLRTFPIQQTRRGFRQGWIVAFVGVAAVLLFAVVPGWITSYRNGSVKTPGDILYMLLSRDRPFEAQLAEEPHRERVRGRASPPDFDYAQLGEEMTQRSADQYEMGKFYLIQQDFDRALPNLESAEKDPGAPPAVHNDLGVAYLERGGDENRALAGKEFTHALDRNPNYLPAIFNRSILFDREDKHSEADSERRKYLQLDSKSGWATEVRRKLERTTR